MQGGEDVQNSPRRQVVLLRSHFPDIRIEKEAACLAQNGYAVTLLAWDRGRTVPPAAGAPPYTIKKFYLAVGSDDLRVALYLPLWWLFIIYHLLVMRFDRVHAADLDTYLPSLLVAKMKRKVIIYDIFDFYADMIRFPVFPVVSRKIIGYFDRLFMNFADHIILPDASRIEQIGGVRTRSIVIIMNSPEEHAIRGLHREDHQKNEVFSIFYGGVLNEDRYVDAMCTIVAEMPGVALAIKGSCSVSYAEKLRAISAGAPNISLSLTWVAYREILQSTLSSDMLFALYDPSVRNNRYASPNKLFEAMLCGKPIVVSEGTSMARIVREENCGLIVPFGNAERVREAIETLRNDIHLRQELGNQGKRAYCEKYSWAIMEQRLIDMYRTMDLPGTSASAHGR
jgi:glycosyltransferase involved in cell wall biosynthesis